jgi:hypothetical protein
VSATILSFPERTYEPDVAGAFKLIDAVKDRPAALIQLAAGCLRLVEGMQGTPEPHRPADYQRLVNATALALFALAEWHRIPLERLADAIIGGAA